MLYQKSYLILHLLLDSAVDPDGIFLWFPSQNRTFLVRKPYVFGTENVRFWNEKRKREIT